MDLRGVEVESLKSLFLPDVGDVAGDLVEAEAGEAGEEEEEEEEGAEEEDEEEEDEEGAEGVPGLRFPARFWPVGDVGGAGGFALLLPSRFGGGVGSSKPLYLSAKMMS